MSKTCEESLKELHKSFNADAAKDLNACYQFNISGEDGGTWVLEIKNGACNVLNGPIEHPTVSISISDKDWLDIHSGSLNSQMAFMMGKLRVDGDMSLALKLQSLFPGPA